jgi:predicted metalloprotease with PDZ domain
MRLLASRFNGQHGITNPDIENALAQVCRCDMREFFRQHIYGAGRVDFDHYLGLIGLRSEVTWSRAVNPDGTPAVDLRIAPLSTEGEVILRIGNPQSAWGKAGLHTGDRLVSVDGRRVTSWSEFREWLRGLKVGDVGRLVVIRDGVSRTVEVRIDPYDVPRVSISERADATVRQKRLRQMWLAAN